MLHSTHCEILGDLLPQNFTIQYTLQDQMALSFVLRTFEERPFTSSYSHTPEIKEQIHKRAILRCGINHGTELSSSAACTRASTAATAFCPQVSVWTQRNGSLHIHALSTSTPVPAQSIPHKTQLPDAALSLPRGDPNTPLASTDSLLPGEVYKESPAVKTESLLHQSANVVDASEFNEFNASSVSSNFTTAAAKSSAQNATLHLNAASLPVNAAQGSSSGSSLYLVQNHQCLLLNLSAEQVQQYIYLMQNRSKFLFYVSGRLLPSSLLLATDSRNQSSDSKLTSREPLRNLTAQFKKVRHQQQVLRELRSSKGELSSEQILVVEKLYIIDPMLQKQPQQLQDTLLQHQVSAAICQASQGSAPTTAAAIAAEEDNAVPAPAIAAGRALSLWDTQLPYTQSTSFTPEERKSEACTILSTLSTAALESRASPEQSSHPLPQLSFSRNEDYMSNSFDLTQCKLPLADASHSQSQSQTSSSAEAKDTTLSLVSSTTPCSREKGTDPLCTKSADAALTYIEAQKLKISPILPAHTPNNMCFISALIDPEFARQRLLQVRAALYMAQHLSHSSWMLRW